jgi:hypothetical protein
MWPGAGHSPRKLVEYDGIHRRVWIRGQRCHHGATGTIVAALACLGLIVEPPLHEKPPPRSLLALALTGGALMAHDWHDRSLWFKRGDAS